MVTLVGHLYRGEGWDGRQRVGRGAGGHGTGSQMAFMENNERPCCWQITLPPNALDGEGEAYGWLLILGNHRHPLVPRPVTLMFPSSPRVLLVVSVLMSPPGTKAAHPPSIRTTMARLVQSRRTSLIFISTSSTTLVSILHGIHGNLLCHDCPLRMERESCHTKFSEVLDWSV